METERDLGGRALREGTPLIDGDTATFVWHGEHAPRLTGDFNGWGAQPALELTRVAPRTWAHSLTLPHDAYVEYGYTHDGRSETDPLNPHTVSNGLGAQNSYFYMPDATPAPWAGRERGRPHGKLTRHVVHADHVFVGGKREVYLYCPPVGGPYPLLVVLDGPDYLRRAQLARMVDNLIAHGRIRPLGLAMVANGGQARYVEYACNESTVGFLRSVIVPLARTHLNLVDLEAEPGAFGLLGASMGGLCALYTALRLPAIFGHVISQSGAFALGSLRREPVVFDLVRNLPRQSLRLWMDVGTYEQLLPANRRLYALLREREYDVTYREYAGGHNYTAWRDDVWRGLEAVYGTSQGQGLGRAEGSEPGERSGRLEAAG